MYKCDSSEGMQVSRRYARVQRRYATAAIWYGKTPQCDGILLAID
jgi:hypothetical protein